MPFCAGQTLVIWGHPAPRPPSCLTFHGLPAQQCRWKAGEEIGRVVKAMGRGGAGSNPSPGSASCCLSCGLSVSGAGLSV